MAWYGEVEKVFNEEELIILEDAIRLYEQTQQEKLSKKGQYITTDLRNTITMARRWKHLQNKKEINNMAWYGKVERVFNEEKLIILEDAIRLYEQTQQEKLSEKGQDITADLRNKITMARKWKHQQNKTER